MKQTYVSPTNLREYYSFKYFFQSLFTSSDLASKVKTEFDSVHPNIENVVTWKNEYKKLLSQAKSSQKEQGWTAIKQPWFGKVNLYQFIFEDNVCGASEKFEKIVSFLYQKLQRDDYQLAGRKTEFLPVSFKVFLSEQAYNELKKEEPELVNQLVLKKYNTTDLYNQLVFATEYFAILDVPSELALSLSLKNLQVSDELGNFPYISDKLKLANGLTYQDLHAYKWAGITNTLFFEAPKVFELLLSDVGIWEQRILLEHVYDWYGVYALCFSSKSNKMLLKDNELELYAVLHDIGKGVAHALGNRKDQAKYNYIIAMKILEELQVPMRDAKIILALIKNEILYQYLSNEIDYKGFHYELAKMVVEMDLGKKITTVLYNKVIELLYVCYICDMYSYSSEVTGFPSFGDYQAVVHQREISLLPPLADKYQELIANQLNGTVLLNQYVKLFDL